MSEETVLLEPPKLLEIEFSKFVNPSLQLLFRVPSFVRYLTRLGVVLIVSKKSDRQMTKYENFVIAMFDLYYYPSQQSKTEFWRTRATTGLQKMISKTERGIKDPSFFLDRIIHVMRSVGKRRRMPFMLFNINTEEIQVCTRCHFVREDKSCGDHILFADVLVDNDSIGNGLSFCLDNNNVRYNDETCPHCQSKSGMCIKRYVDLPQYILIRIQKPEELFTKKFGIDEELQFYLHVKYREGRDEIFKSKNDEDAESQRSNAKTKKKNYNYGLIGYMSHKGRRINDGSIISLIRNDETRKWYRCHDETIESIDSEESKEYEYSKKERRKCVICLYERKTLRTNRIRTVNFINRKNEEDVIQTSTKIYGSDSTNKKPFDIEKFMRSYLKEKYLINTKKETLKTIRDLEKSKNSNLKDEEVEGEEEQENKSSKEFDAKHKRKLHQQEQLTARKQQEKDEIESFDFVDSSEEEEDSMKKSEEKKKTRIEAFDDDDEYKIINTEFEEDEVPKFGTFDSLEGEYKKMFKRLYGDERNESTSRTVSSNQRRRRDPTKILSYEELRDQTDQKMNPIDQGDYNPNKYSPRTSSSSQPKTDVHGSRKEEKQKKINTKRSSPSSQQFRFDWEKTGVLSQKKKTGEAEEIRKSHGYRKHNVNIATEIRSKVKEQKKKKFMRKVKVYERGKVEEIWDCKSNLDVVVFEKTFICYSCKSEFKRVCGEKIKDVAERFPHKLECSKCGKENLYPVMGVIDQKVDFFYVKP